VPIYVYQCRDCGANLEELRAMSASDVPAQCSCGSRNTQRKLAVFSRSRSASSEPEERQSANDDNGPAGLVFDKCENATVVGGLVKGFETAYRIRDSSAYLRGNRSIGARNRLVVEGDSYVRSEGNDYG
jgi:putative FmdB family regulatory protein